MARIVHRKTIYSPQCKTYPDKITHHLIKLAWFSSVASRFVLVRHIVVLDVGDLNEGSVRKRGLHVLQSTAGLEIE